MTSTIEHNEQKPITLRTLARMARLEEPFACLTCYDATTARWLERAGLHVLLVGDTAAEVVLGYDSTLHMPLDVSIALTAGVKRGALNTVVMGDMPFMSYQADEASAIRNAGRYLTEGLADIVKLEVDRSFADLVAKMARAGIPVCGHIGAKPQQVGLTGGYAAAGRTAAAARAIVDDAMALEDAGCVMLLAEAIPEEVTARIIESTNVPVIGIGAGPACHGQILVLQDLLGLTEWQPGFATPVAHLGTTIQSLAEQWVSRVANRNVTDHRYRMKDGEADKLEA
ncbi:MAG: 3-methyl-2-oxobutanoate hydroxymethyltransferase [Phycisphaerales bacterium]|nr:3-methyl-2-oxobutanoate hydroxymethyltransferase [Phycisphaerales bacterium]